MEPHSVGLWPAGHIYMMRCLVNDGKQEALQVLKSTGVTGVYGERRERLYFFEL